MTENKVTDIIESTQELMNSLVSKLSAYSSWTVEKYCGTDINRLFAQLSTLPLPAAVVSYKGSSYNDEVPRRTANFSVYVLTEDVGDITEAAADAQPLLDKALELIDREEYQNVMFKAVSDSEIVVGQNVAAYELSIEAHDF